MHHISKSKSQLYSDIHLISYIPDIYIASSLILRETKEKDVPMSSNKSLHFSPVQCSPKVIILVSLIIVLVKSISITYIIMQICLLITILTPACCSMHVTLIYTHLIISMLKNHENCISFVISHLPFLSFTSLRLVLQILKCTSFIRNCKNKMSCENCVKNCDAFKKKRKFLKDYHRIIKISFHGLPGKVLRLISTRYFFCTMIFKYIISKIQTLLLKDNCSHLKTINNQFLTRPHDHKLPFTKNNTISIIRISLSS